MSGAYTRAEGGSLSMDKDSPMSSRVELMDVAKCPTDEFSLKNCAVISDAESFANRKSNTKIYVKASRTNGSGEFYLTVIPVATRFKLGTIGLSGVQRDWMRVSIDRRDKLEVERILVDRMARLIGTVVVEVDFYQRPTKKQFPPVNTDDIAEAFINLFRDNIFCQNQIMVLQLGKAPLLKARVHSIKAEDTTGSGKSRELNYGILYSASRVLFEKKAESTIQLTGRYRGDSTHMSLISPDWDFKKMGIGGLKKEFSDIFRRAFASRVFPPDIIEQLGMKHVRGILLHGPPGTGKTLMAREIGKMLHAREPLIINGPEILNKYVGESEAGIRRLFSKAEEEQKKMGIDSALHIIIFDEIDAICRTRGSLTGSTGVHDTVVNQLLAKLDGVEQLNNILLIGMTNRVDMIDEALLRPGRLEVKIEIGLPNEAGRLEILRIHTARMQEYGKLADDIRFGWLATRTKNFSGAEIEGLVRSAQDTAMNRITKAGDKVMVTRTDAEQLLVTMADFEYALEHDIKPAFGSSDEQLERYVYNGIIPWNRDVDYILDVGTKAVKTAAESVRMRLVTLLLRGRSGCGKTALAAYIAKQSLFPFVKVVTPENMVGYTEGAKCQAIKTVFDDAYKSEISCVIMDDIERLLDYVAYGPRFSNTVLQTLLVLLRKLPPVSPGKNPPKLLVIGTTGLSDEVLELLGVQGAFGQCIEVPYLTEGDDVYSVLQQASENIYSSRIAAHDLAALKGELIGKSCCVGIKKLLTVVEAGTDSLIHTLKMECRLK